MNKKTAVNHRDVSELLEVKHRYSAEYRASFNRFLMAAINPIGRSRNADY